MLTGFVRAAALALMMAALLPSGQPERRHPIIYVQAVKYQASVTPARAAAILRSARDTFGRMPQVRSVRIGHVARTNGPGYEYALIMEFASLDDLKAYGESGVHRDWVKEHADARIEQHLMLTVDATTLEK